MASPPLRVDFFDESTPAANNMSAAEYNLNATRTDAAYDAGVASTAALPNKQPLHANLTALAGLVDPNADRLVFWDESANTFVFLVAGTGLTITGTTITASGSSGEVLGRVLRVGPTNYAATIPSGGPDSAFLVLDKVNAANDCSVLFRDIGVQKWEIGLPGDDDLHIKRVTGASDAALTFVDVFMARYSDASARVETMLGIGQWPVEPLHVAKNNTAARVNVKVENTATTGSGSASLILSGRGGGWTLTNDAGMNGGNNFAFMSDTAGWPPLLMITGTRNISVNGDYTGAGTGVLFIADRTAAPTATQAGGSILWSDSGVLRDDLGVVDVAQYITLTAAYTLASQTAAQKLFNTPTNGAVTLPAGTYFFECQYDLSSMSATSGSFGFTLAAGTATISGTKWHASANKAALATPVSPQESVNTAANTTLATASTNTVGWARISGKVRVSVAGTVIPQVSLGVAAAAVVGADSYFRIWSAGSVTATSAGNWS